MEQKYLIFMLGFEVSLEDRRSGEIEGDFIVIPYPGEHKEDLQDAADAIRKYYGRLGYDVKEIKHQESRVKELDLKKEYDAAQNIAEYFGME